MTGPLTRYDQLVDDGKLQPDDAQRAAAQALQDLHRRLEGYEPSKPSGLGRFFGKTSQPPRGLYLWGGVGRGKSLLMDLFFNNVPVEAKRRVHFHAFMVRIHEAMAEWRGLSEADRKAKPYRVKSASLDDPVPHVARAAFDAGWLICFDEFHVTDIADAMLLGRLFETLFEMGAVVVATSNRHPKDLYKDGINRDLFEPFIDIIEGRCIVHQLAAARDYRLEQLTGNTVYHCPLGPDADKAMDAAWARLIAGGTAREKALSVRGRKLVIPQTACGAARVSFREMCGRALGAEDYLCIAESYPTVFMDNIPTLSPENRNEAKRFVTFIDALYEARTKFVCSADAPPQDLYTAGDGAFEFERTVSRLMEMQSESYLAQEHRVTRR